MATLNTLRTRGGVIVSIVIGIALLAFLLGDFASTGNMMNARKMRVGEINGNKIGYIEYSDQVDYYTQVFQLMYGKESLSTEETDQVKNVAWDKMIDEYVYSPGFADLGIEVSEAEQIDMVDGTYMSPVISGNFVDPQTGTYDPNIVRNFVASISQDPSGSRSMLWNYLKDQMISQRQLSKYMELVSGGMFVTNLEIEQGVAHSNTVSNISYVMQEYTQIADSTINVTDAEIRAYYDEHKNMFRQVGARDIEYVTFNVLPSASDYEAAEKTINEMAAEFETNDNPLQYATLNSHEQVSKSYLSESQMTPALAAFAFGPDNNKMYGPVKEGDTYTMARVADVRMMPDSLGARHILIAAGETARADSLVKVLKNGGDFAALAGQYSIEPGAAQRGGDLGVFTPDQMIPEFSEALLQASVGDIFTVTTQFGIHVVELTHKSPLKKKVQLAEIAYNIEPSNMTQQSVYSNASKFIADANGSYDNFKKAAADAGMASRAVRVRSTDRNISGINNSREVVRWAFTAEQGDVSSIIEVDGDYVIAVLDGITEDGIAPMDKVSADITTILRFEKKGEMLAEKMQGTSLSEVASKLGKEVSQAEGIDFNSFYIDGIGVEPKLIGAVAAAQPNVLSKPVTGSTGVYLFDVTSRENVDNTTAESEKVRLNAMGEAYISERVGQAIFNASDIKDVRVKFF